MLDNKRITSKTYRKTDKRASMGLKIASAATLLTASSLSLLALNSAIASAAQLAQKHTSAAVGGTTHSTAAPARVIVTFSGDLSSSDHVQLAKLGCDVYRNLDFIHSAALSLPKINLAKLSALPFVKHVSADAAVEKTDEFTMDASQASVAYAANNNLTGKGVTVALLDSGMVSGNPEQQGTAASPYQNTRILGNISMIPNASYYDQCGHGTHVAGILGGNGYYSTGPYCTHTFYGIARGVSFLNVRVLDGTGSGVVSNVISALQLCVKYKSYYNIRIINLSLGMPVTQSYTTDPLCMAVEAAWKAGIVVVCAAGNNGRLNPTVTAGAPNYGYGTNYGSIESPGNDPYVITVGATKRIDGLRADDVIASYSSRGPTLADCVAKPDIVTAGNKIISDLAQGSYLYNQYSATNAVPFSAYTYATSNYSSWNYFVLSGTSMATPVVSGAAALLLQQYPNLTPDTVKARLMMSADPITLADGTSDILSDGAGYLDIPAALKSTVVATSPAMSPSLYVDPNGNVMFTANASLYGSVAVQNANGTWSAPASATIWGTGQTSLAAIYGTAPLTGPSLVNTNRALWGDTSLSSSSTIVANRALWGDSGLAASRALWGDSSPQVDLSSIALNGE